MINTSSHNSADSENSDKATVKDVATKAAVSVSTVSRAFTRPDLVSNKTREKVLKAAHELDFSISRSAGALRSGQSHRVALLVGNRDMEEWFTALTFEGIDSVLHDADYDVSIYPIGNINERHKFFENLPIRKNADAVIVSSFDVDAAEVTQLSAMEVPVVGINTEWHPGFSAVVGIDDAAGVQLSARHLVTMGHKNIVYLFRTFTSPLKYSSESRIQGFINACHEEDPSTNVTIVNATAGTDTFDSVLTEILSVEERPTAICCHQDSLAIPLLYKMRQYGFSVPEDMSVIGFDDSTYANEVGLTTIHQDPRKMGQSAALTALQLIEKQPNVHTRQVFPTKLLTRATTAPPKGM